MLSFELVDGISPLIIGMDVRRYSDSTNRESPHTITFQRPHDTTPFTFNTYIADDDGGNPRTRLDIAPNKTTTISSLMSNIVKRKELNLAKRIHRFGHSSVSDMMDIMTDANLDTEKLRHACQKVYDACDICAASGRPKIKKKISLSHVNEGFNQEVQADFLYAVIGDKNYEILNIIDVGTKYGERSLAESRSCKEMKRLFEESWFYRHGAPRRFSADHEFCRSALTSFMELHEITVNPRPSRSSHKCGQVERNNGIFKLVVGKLQRADPKATPSNIIARASFVTNLLRGSRIMSSFQLARGYSPSVHGIPRRIMPQSLLDAHIEREATRALERVRKFNAPNTLSLSSMSTGDTVLVFYRSSKMNEADEWIKAKIVDVRPHQVICRRSVKGPPMTVAIEDVRLLPKGELAQEIVQRDENEDNTQNIAQLCGFVHESMPVKDSCESEAVQIDAHTGDAEMKDATNMPERRSANECEESREIRASNCLMTEVAGTPPCSSKDIADGLRTASGDADPTTDRATQTVEDMKLRTEFMLLKRRQGIAKDIGKEPSNTAPPEGDLASHKQEILKQVKDSIENRLVSISKLEGAPSWVVQHALKEEHDCNWARAYIEVHERTLPPNANIISSHVGYKIKKEEDGKLRLKARICPHGNRDAMKDGIRKDSATAQFDVIRLMLSLATILSFNLGVVDVSGAYMQSGPIKRNIYVRPPREWDGTPRGKVWYLLKLPYGIVEAGRQWALVIEDWLLNDAGMQRVNGISQLYMRRDSKGQINLILAKVTDDILIAGNVDEIQQFIQLISQRFKISKSITNKPINFNGCQISQRADGSISMSMKEYLDSVNAIQLGKNRRSEYMDKATKTEYDAYRSLAGCIIWTGHATLPFASFIGSNMQQIAPRLRVCDVMEGNKMLKESRDLEPAIVYNKPKSAVTRIEVWTYSDASFNISSTKEYGQSGILMGLMIYTEDNDNIFHVVDWSSSKQRRVSHSSYGAEILACSDADDRGYALRESMRAITNEQVRNILHVDSRGLFDTISTLHDGREYRLRQTVQRIRDSFEAGDIDILRWVPSNCNMADGLTKRNPMLQRKLNRLCLSGVVTENDDKMELDSSKWK